MSLFRFRVLAASTVLVVSGCMLTDPFRTQFDDREAAVLYQAARPSAVPAGVDTVKVMTWNIRYGAARIPLFYDGYGDRHTMTESEVLQNLENIAAKIRAANPDILLLQEADVQSTRTAYVDEIQYLLDHTGLYFGAYASIWKADYVPSDGLGRMNMGNAILSKWPIGNALRIALPIRTDQSGLEEYFWFHRNILKVSIDMPGAARLFVLNMHAESWGSDGTKKKHLDIFKQELDRVHCSGDTFIAGGDFNEIPPGSPQWNNFPDTPPSARFGGDDYTGQETWLDSLYAAYAPAIPLTEFQALPTRYFTYTGDAAGYWNRTLDYLFTNAAWVSASGMVLQDSLLPNGSVGPATMPLSDHAPLFAKVKVR